MSKAGLQICDEHRVSWTDKEHCDACSHNGMTRTMAEATTTEMQNLLGQGYGAIQQQLADQRITLNVICEHQLKILERFTKGLEAQAARSAAIEEKLDRVTETQDAIVKYAENGKQTRVETIDKLDDILALLAALPVRLIRMLERHEPAIAMTETPRRVGRKPARKVRPR